MKWLREKKAAREPFSRRAHAAALARREVVHAVALGMAHDLGLYWCVLIEMRTPVRDLS